MRQKGFTFNGKYSGDFGLWYIPSPANRMQNTAEYELREATVTGKHGGYYYGSQVDIREMTLECYFEEITMNVFEDMIQWLHRDVTGDLVFDERPFVTYTATTWKKPTGKVYFIRKDDGIEELYSGTMSVFFKCYDPFGRMAYTAYDTYDTDNAQAHCGIIESREMPEAISPTLGTHLIYNPGTEICDTVIRIGGTAPNGQTITNSSGDVCTLTMLPASGYLELDSKYGTVKVMPTDELAFEYHDLGYIRLLPCTPYERNIYATYTANSNIVRFLTFNPNESTVGKYILLDGEWLRIAALNGENSVIVSKNMSETGSEQAMIATMNEQNISGDGATLTMFEMDYTPLLR